MTCRELAELIAMEGVDALGPEEQRHLRECHGCTVYVESLTVTVRSLSELPGEPAEPEVHERLLVLFRQHRG